MDENVKYPLSHLEIAKLNEKLLANVVKAKTAYEEAKIEASRLRATVDHLDPGHPDGAEAARSALRLERISTRRYSEAVKALTDFVLDKKLPK